MKQSNMEQKRQLKPKKQSTFVEEIKRRKSMIETIKTKHSQKVQLMNQQMEQTEMVGHKKTKAYQTAKPAVDKMEIPIKAATPSLRTLHISQTQKLMYQKRFKTFLNHRQQYQAQLQQRRNQIILNRKALQSNTISPQQYLMTQKQLLQDKSGENLFDNGKQMNQYCQEMQGGKGRRQAKLEGGEKREFLFRRQEFDYLCVREEGRDDRDRENQLPTLATQISKGTLLEYLFEQKAIMMLYSINPFQLGDQLHQHPTLTPNLLTFQQFSSFLLLPRPPTSISYTEQTLSQAYSLGRGLKCLPIIGKWVGQEQRLQWLMQMFRQVDMMGEGKVEKGVLAKKIRKEVRRNGWEAEEVVEVVNIGKMVTMDRLLYQLQYSQGDYITLSQFEAYLTNYKRLKTPQKDRLTTKLILSGKYDPSYIFILNQQTIQVIKESFLLNQLYCQYFLPTPVFTHSLQTHPKYPKIHSQQVRSQPNKYLPKQTVQKVLQRLMNEADPYVDLEEVLDFFTNRGRPYKVEVEVKMENLRRQLEGITFGKDGLESTSDDEEFQEYLRVKAVRRKHQKLDKIRAQERFEKGKQFLLTVPNPFSFGMGTKQGKKTSIRQKKVLQMLTQKRQAQDLSMAPLKPRAVPSHVHQDLYQKLQRQQQRDRKQRLQKFRRSSIQNMYPVSQHLFKKPHPQNHCTSIGEEYKFVAKPLPWYCEVNLMERIQKEKEERRERILEEIINRNSEYDLPEGVRRMMDRQQEMIEKKQRNKSYSKTTADVDYTFMPKITQGVPDFKMIHEHLHFDLQNKKQQKQPIKLQPFSFQNRPSRSRTTLSPHKAPHRPLQQKAEPKQSSQINIPITMKYQALVNLRQKQQKQRHQKVQEEKKATTIRRMRQQRFAPYVREALRKSQQMDPSRSRAIVEEKIKEFKKQQRRKKAAYDQQMIKIYTKVFKRPLLIQTSGVPQNQARLMNQQQEQQHHQDYVSGYQLTKPQGKQQDHRQIKGKNDYKQKMDRREEQRRVAMEHPPRNYLIEEPNQQEDQEDQEYEGEYLSENGRYTS